ncbi:MAG: two-component regulator propeller domain-containing protein [Flavobacteriales bacterium]
MMVINSKHKRTCGIQHVIYFVLSAFLSLTITHDTFCQQYTYINYSLKEGLAQSQVRCLFQDSRGFIWAGTLGGLSKFDGTQFQNYDRQSGLPDNQINCIIELKDGTIAAGSNGNVVMVNALGTRFIPLAESMRETTVNTLFEDPNGRLWIGTEKGLAILENGVITLFGDELGAAHIKSIHGTSSGLVMALTKEKLVVLRGDKIENSFVPEDPETNFFDMAQSPDGHIWLACKGEGMIVLDANAHLISNFRDHPQLTTNTTTGVLISAENEVYLTSRFGYYKFDGTHFQCYNEKSGLPTNDIRDILQDREGNIWIATYGHGILRFTGEAFTSYTEKDGLIGNAVMSITEDQQGNFWYSTFDKGICRSDGDSIVQYDLKQLTQVNRIWSSICDYQNRLWFASSDGLFEYHNNSFSQYSTRDSLPSDMVLSLFMSEDSVLWIGTSRGLCTWKNGAFHPVNETNSPAKRVRCIREDRAGNMWFATSEGVYRYDGKAYTNFSVKDGLPDNSTNCIEIDAFNRIWIGTQNGLAALNGIQFFASDVYNTSGSDVINFLKYHDGILWIGTNNGLHSTIVNDKTNERDLTFVHYGLEEGLRSLETNLNAVYVDRNNKLWFGTTDGVTRINTSLLAKNLRDLPPLLSLSKIQINLQDQNWTKLGFPVNAITGLAENLVLKYKQNHLTFYFKAISTTYPEAVQYQYMLEGFDDDWKALTTNEFATYSNLPYRTFTFKVKALSRDGVWSDPVIYSFKIRPPFWLTWWFIALEVLILAGIVTWIVYNRRRIIKSKREKEWFEIRSKMLALEQQSLNSSMNRHFIFNALNSIQYYINRQDRLSANRYLSDFAKLIRKNLDSSQDNLTSLRDEIERLELYMKLEHMRFKDKFEYKINIDPALNLDQIKVPAMLVQPFLENSIWHGLLPRESQGYVQIDIISRNGHVEFMITDNGVGIDNSLKNKTGTDSHISKGMEITQNRIELIKKTTGKTVELRGPYQIAADDPSAGGTRVEIILPENFNELF